MLYHRHIETTGMAHTFSERAHRPPVMIRSRTPRDVRSRFIMPGLSGESMAESFPRERDGVGERELRSGGVDHHPSGESGSAPFPRERGGVPERDVRSGEVDRRPFRESTSTCTGSRASEMPIPKLPFKNHSCTTSRFVQPATSGGVCDVRCSLNLITEFVFPRGW
jgi:hypothetical protein